MNKKLLLLVVLVVMFSISGCGKNTDTDTNTSANTNAGPNNQNQGTPLPDNTVRVKIQDAKFVSRTALINAGMTVMWVNQDNTDHQIKSAAFSSPVLKPGDTFSYTFDNVGVYEYTCSIHPTMAGTISVQAKQ